MKEISIQELVNLAKQFHLGKEKWHFHMLAPNCLYNNRKGKHTFILENETKNEFFIVYSDQKYVEEGKELVKLLHGDKIVENKDLNLETIDEKIKLILKKAKKLSERGIHWHHHMLFPNCVFNKHKGQWVIVFEDDEENEIIESISKNEPIENLRAIESAFYQQKNSF